jgi:hypothetical protein
MVLFPLLAALLLFFGKSLVKSDPTGLKKEVARTTGSVVGALNLAATRAVAGYGEL